MKEQGIYPKLEDIRGRLERDKTFKQQTKGRKESPDEIIRRYIYGTPIARTDFLVSPEDLDSLSQKIEQVRGFLFSNGQNFTKHPDCAEMNPVFATPIAEENWRNNFWWADGDFEIHLAALPSIFNVIPGREPDAPIRIYTSLFEVSADKHERLKDELDPGDITFGDRLFMDIIDGKYFVHIDFDFEDRYNLRIAFFNDENWDKSRAHYMHPSELESGLEYSAELPVEKMTQEDKEIIEYYLKQFWAKVK